MANGDRRYTYRLDLPEDRVRVLAPSAGRVVVADLSASGSGLIVNPSDFEGMTAEPATFEFGTGRSFSVMLEPVRVSRKEGQLRVGARFQDLPVAGMRVLSEFLIREFLDEKRSLERLLLDPRALSSSNATFISRHLRRCLIHQRRPLRIYQHGNLLPFTIMAERIVELSGRRLIRCRSGHTGLVSGGVYTFVVALPGSVTHFTARIERISNDVLFIPLPAELHQAGFRDSVRKELQADGRPTVRCAHPRLPEELSARPLLDLSNRGFAFESDPERDLLFPGDRLSSFQIHFADEVFEGTGIIRGIAPHKGSDLYSCGVEIVEFADAGQELQWRQRVFRHVHPRAVVAEPHAAARQAWQVLDDSGYLRLWTAPESQERLRDAYRDSWSDAPHDVGRLMLVESHGKTVGTLAGSRLYPRTWLVHQLGVAESERAGLAMFLGLAYELYSGLMNLFQQQAAVEYFVIFAERDRRWTETLYGDFVARYPNRSAFVYDYNKVFRRDLASPISRIIVHNPTINVVPADATQLEQVSRALRESTSALEFDAMAYGVSEIGLERFSDQCETLGSERTRTIYIGMEGGVAVAALVAETGSEGVNIFGLMNRCFVINLTSEPVTPPVNAALLEIAEQHFQRLEKQVFLFFGEPSVDPEDIELLGFEFISEGMRFIASKQLVPAWLSYLENVLSIRNTSENGRSA